MAAPIRDQFLDLLAAGRLVLVRKETVEIGTTVEILCRPSTRRAVLVITNASANQLDLDWENPGITAGTGLYQLPRGETYIELYDTRAGGIGEPIWGTLHAIKTTAAGDVRILEYEVKP